MSDVVRNAVIGRGAMVFVRRLSLDRDNMSVVVRKAVIGQG